MKRLLFRFFIKPTAIRIIIMLSIFSAPVFSQQSKSLISLNNLTENQILGFEDENGNKIFPAEDTTGDAFQTRNFTGFNSGDYYGNSLSTAGDVNGDGFADIIIGAPYNDGIATNAGRAYIYYGGLSVNTLPDIILSGESSLNYFGYSVSSAGDVNGDGYSDVIVGAYAYSNKGRAYIYLGGTGMNNAADVVMTGDSSGMQFGYSVSSAGDVSGDGYCDVIIGAPGFGGNSTGRALVFFGGASMNNSADVTLTGESGQSRFGYSVSSAGDVNGDGYADVISGAYEYDFFTGKAYLYFGSSSMNNAADLTFTGDAENIYFGWSVASAGDVNGDGFSDIIISAPAHSTLTGKAGIYFGGINMNNIADVVMTGSGTGYQFGVSVASAGDLNGDGYDDVIIGADAYSSFTGRAFIYYGGTVMNNTADFVMTGESAGCSFGFSVSSAGDVNGDGYSDVIAGAYGYSSNTGKAYLYMFGMNGTLYSDLYFNGEASNNYSGYSAASAGDVNGDGYSDIIIGAWGYNSNTGRVYLFYGGLNMDNAADVTFTGDGTGQYFGWSVASAGDVNGDGYCDVIIGAYTYSSYTGKAGIYYGGASMNNSVDVLMFGPGVNYNFGYSVASAGDVNGDGYCDVIIGANEYNSATGSAFIFYGGSNMNNTPDVNMTGETTSNNFGASVASAGDVNGDGYADVVVGAYSYSTNTGRAYVYYGGTPMNNTSDVTMTGEASGIRFGISVASAGDVNGDSFSDVIIGASSFFSFTGRAYIYLGNSSMNNTADVIMTGEGTTNYFGISVASAGDMNKDGYADVAVGANSFNNNTGRAYLFFGGIAMNNIADNTLNGEASGTYFGTSVASAGDVNGDGSSDLIIGAPYYNANAGRSYIYLNKSPNVNPVIMSVKDVLNDQGGYVNIRWARSAYDLNINGLVTNYVIERSPVTESIGFNWVVVGTVPAIHNTIYNYEARTAYDSCLNGNALFNFKVTAYTGNPGEIWQSNIQSGYSVDNLAPLPPENLAGVLVLNAAQLTWNANTETDLRHYIIYRDNIQTGISATLSYTDSTIIPDSTYIYRISAEDIHGNISPQSNPVEITYTVSTIIIKVIPEGYYNAATEKLNLLDTAKANLHYNFSPYSLIDSAVSLIDTVLYTGAFRFYNASNGTYFIVIKHRNTIETWSKSGGEAFTPGTIMNYDFTNASSQAFGNNMIQIDSSPIRFGIFSGDVNQDRVVDGTDGVLIDNDAANFETGYLSTDLNGDEIIDGSDAVIADNNAANFVSAVLP